MWIDGKDNLFLNIRWVDFKKQDSWKFKTWLCSYYLYIPVKKIQDSRYWPGEHFSIQIHKENTYELKKVVDSKVKDVITFTGEEIWNLFSEQKLLNSKNRYKKAKSDCKCTCSCCEIGCIVHNQNQQNDELVPKNGAFVPVNDNFSMTKEEQQQFLNEFDEL